MDVLDAITLGRAFSRPTQAQVNGLEATKPLHGRAEPTPQSAQRAEPMDEFSNKA